MWEKVLIFNTKIVMRKKVIELWRTFKKWLFYLCLRKFPQFDQVYVEQYTLYIASFYDFFSCDLNLRFSKISGRKILDKKEWLIYQWPFFYRLISLDLIFKYFFSHDFFFDGFVYNYPSMLVRESVKLLYYQINRGSGKSSFKFIGVQGHLLL